MVIVNHLSINCKRFPQIYYEKVAWNLNLQKYFKFAVRLPIIFTLQSVDLQYFLQKMQANWCQPTFKTRN